MALSKLPAADVLRGLGESENNSSGTWRLPRRKASVSPVIRVVDRTITGALDLRAVEVPYLLEFVRCTFEETPDLRQSRIAGIEFNECSLPGFAGRNLSSDNDVAFISCTVTGQLDLVDADIAGTLVLRDSTFHSRGRPAVQADRVTLAGALLGFDLRTSGELRLAGARIGGNCNLNGAVLDNEDGMALNANGVQVGGNMLCSFTARGTVFLTNAKISSALSLRGANLSRGPATVDTTDPHADPNATLVLDRTDVSGDVGLDRGFVSAGTLRLVNANIGGSLSLVGASVDAISPPQTGNEPIGRGRALHMDGAQIGGDVVGRNMRIKGQLRMVDLHVRGSLILDGSRLENPQADCVLANRCVVGSNFAVRDAEVEGGLELRGVNVGANLDLRGSRLIAPGRYRHQPKEKPSLDIGGAIIGRDLVCAQGDKEFVAHGGVRCRRATIGRMANFNGAVLGYKLDSHALNGMGMQVQELMLNVVTPPKGDVTLRQGRCTSLDDNAIFWQATGYIDLDDFRYDSLASPIDLRDDAQVELRLHWLRQATRRAYRPRPYDQFAEMLQASGNDEHASTVMIEKQRLRYKALAEGMRFYGPLVLLWSWLQRSMVGYGYRPARALGWLIASWLLGSLWFEFKPDLVPINADDHLPWNAWLYTIDLVVPIVDFGNKNRWQTPGASQWIASGLIVTGWMLATTVAAGLTRMLKR
ncbi:hypothetical protein FKR81_07535 [Lentzea tibetensis]|uniref:Membrane-associated oxidoreductase n=1 Tax=Lentzea tibetensis TaxID=2591470 RepID=A0A563EZ52_9PSEU|nr:hypothetical protein [Lentzea tibetensis]TWP52949.1 hypothetical protein FKR81_07535 [Lentzea tibetensis]